MQIVKRIDDRGLGASRDADGANAGWTQNTAGFKGVLASLNEKYKVIWGVDFSALFFVKE